MLPGSFYNLFETKEEAVVTVVRQALEAVDPDPGRRGQDTVEALTEAYIRFISDEPVLARIYVQLAVAGGADDHRLRGRILRHHANRLDRFADGMSRSRPGLTAAEARRRAEFLLAALQGLTIWTCSTRPSTSPPTPATCWPAPWARAHEPRASPCGPPGLFRRD